jgi:hypothetical protein
MVTRSAGLYRPTPTTAVLGCCYSVLSKARVLDADPANDRVAEDWLNIRAGQNHPVVW